MEDKLKDENGKEYNLSDFDDTRSWSKAKQDKGFYGHMTTKKAGKKVKMCGRGD